MVRGRAGWIHVALAHRACLCDRSCMKKLTGITTSHRTREGWIPLPYVIRGLREAELVAIDVGGQRYLIGHAVRQGLRWYVVPDWRTSGIDPDSIEDPQ